MQKKVNNVKSVNQRLLTKSERHEVDNLLEIYGNLIPDGSFEARGKYMKSEPMTTMPLRTPTPTRSPSTMRWPRSATRSATFLPCRSLPARAATR